MRDAYEDATEAIYAANAKVEKAHRNSGRALTLHFVVIVVAVIAPMPSSAELLLLASTAVLAWAVMIHYGVVSYRLGKAVVEANRVSRETL